MGLVVKYGLKVWVRVCGFILMFVFVIEMMMYWLGMVFGLRVV